MTKIEKLDANAAALAFGGDSSLDDFAVQDYRQRNFSRDLRHFRRSANISWTKLRIDMRATSICLSGKPKFT
jgi:hypothetical protein